MNFVPAHPTRLKNAPFPTYGSWFQPKLGWLASHEAFEYLLGAPEIDDYLRNVLWAAKLRGEGFEGALSMVQGAFASSKSDEAKHRLNKFTQAVVGMFDAMQLAFNKLDYRESDLRLQRFLSQFRCDIHAKSRHPAGDDLCGRRSMVRAMVRDLSAIHEIHKGTGSSIYLHVA